MRKDQNLPQQRIIGRPFCEVCKAQMWLACIEPDKPDYDKRTFECPVCPNVTVKVVKYRTSRTPPTDMESEAFINKPPAVGRDRRSNAAT